jgi:hypothetical protein
VASWTWPRHSVAIHRNIWIAVGIVMSRLAAVKKLWPSCGSPVANMWWTHTPNPMNAVVTIESTIAV